MKSPESNPHLYRSAKSPRGFGMKEIFDEIVPLIAIGIGVAIGVTLGWPEELPGSDGSAMFC